MTCPHCGAVMTPLIAIYGASPKRAVCSECKKTVRTFITFTDILLLVAVALILLSFFLTASCQGSDVKLVAIIPERFSVAYGGADIDVAFAVAVLEEGGYLLGGNTFSTGAGGQDCLLIKLDDEGGVIWQVTYGGEGTDNIQSLLETPDGEFIVAGYTESFGVGEFDCWVLKLDPDGNIIWQKTYGGSAIEYGKAIRNTSDGGLVLLVNTGSFGAGTHDIWVIKLTHDGDITWQKTYGSTAVENSYTIEETLDGGFVIAGNVNNLNSENMSDTCVIKLASDGRLEWSRKYGGPADDNAYAVTPLANGGYLVAGHTRSFGAGAFDVWVLQLDSIGDIVWQRSYGGGSNDFAFSLYEREDGGLMVGGSSSSFGAGEFDLWILSLNPDGDIEWQETFGGPLDDSGKSYSIRPTGDGGIVVPGRTASYGAGDYDAWLIKIPPHPSSDPFGAVTTATVTDTSVTWTEAMFQEIDTSATVSETFVTTIESNLTRTDVLN